VVSGEPENRWT